MVKRHAVGRDPVVFRRADRPCGVNGFDPLRELAESHGPIGHEDEPRGLVAGEPESAVDRVRTDAMGNVVGTVEESAAADGATDADETVDTDRLVTVVLVAAVIVAVAVLGLIAYVASAGSGSSNITMEGRRVLNSFEAEPPTSRNEQNRSKDQVSFAMTKIFDFNHERVGGRRG